MANLAGTFLLTVDLETFRLCGNPPPRPIEGLFVAAAGHLARDPTEVTEPNREERLALAYRRHGAMLTAHLLGQYAAAIVDPAARRVVLGQDSLGVRPLFYRLNRTQLVASADLESLAALLRPASLNEAYFAEYLASGWPPHRHTPFAGIERLALGETMLIEPPRRVVLRPWSPPQRQKRLPTEEATLRLRSLLDEAVGSALPVRGHVLCELSGGLDSTSVLATAHKLRPDVEALTLFSGQCLSGDDEPYARQAVSALGVRWHRIDIDLFPPFSALPNRFAGEPGDELRVAIHTAFRSILACEGVDVVLTGMAGDAVFGVGALPPLHVADALSTGHILSSIRAARRLLGHGGDQRGWAHSFLDFGVRPSWRHLWRRPLGLGAAASPPAWLARDLVRRNELDGRIGHQRFPRVRLPGSQYLWECIYNLALAQGSAFRLHTDADTRHPLFYRPLVEFMLGLDPCFRNGPHGGRVLQRQALGDRLPEEIRQRWTKGGDQKLWERSLMNNDTWYRLLTEGSRLVALGWVDPGRWRAEVARARFGVFDGLPRFEAAMSTECWLRTIERYPPDDPPELHAPRAGADSHARTA